MYEENILFVYKFFRFSTRWCCVLFCNRTRCRYCLNNLEINNKATVMVSINGGHEMALAPSKSAGDGVQVLHVQCPFKQYPGSSSSETHS